MTLLRSSSKALAFLAALVVVEGCKGEGGPEQVAAVDFPSRVMAGGEGDATAPKSIGSRQPGDGRSFHMDLQRPPPAGTANVWACWDVPSELTPIGRAVCVDDQARSIDLTAANVDFGCSTNPDFQIVEARVPLTLEGCNQYEIFAFAFEPALQLELR